MNRQAEQEAAEQQKEYEKLLGHVRSLMKTQDGKRVIWHILSQCGVYDTNYTGNNDTFFLQGRRDIGLNIIGLLSDVEPTLYPELQLWMAKDGRRTDES